jgi:hypothetical protein
MNLAACKILFEASERNNGHGVSAYPAQTSGLLSILQQPKKRLVSVTAMHILQG